MSKPIIGLTTRTAAVSSPDLPSVMLQRSYTSAIINAGGIPLLIPSEVDEGSWLELTEHLDGILFTGGGDIDVVYFDGENHPAVYGIEPARDEIELGLAKIASKDNIPFLGICRGIQVINVALGGTLYTHIPEQISNALLHDYPGEDSIQARTSLLHTVKIESDSILAKILGETNLHVNSLHHQGVKDVAPSLVISARSTDGLVEAVELPHHPFGIAVQWHPEWLTDQLAIRNLFKAFVAASVDKQK